jgi:hypothetical protein
MSQENLPDAGQMSRTRRFIDWLWKPWPTPKLIAWLVGIWLVPTALDWILNGVDWAQFARYTVAIFIIGALGVIWNQRRWRKASSNPE